ncbi:MAG: SPFH domain-containing protein [Planctomycetota bacterium]
MPFHLAAGPDPTTLLWAVLAGGGLLIAAFACVTAITHFMYICRPNELLVFSGRTSTTPDGRKVGYRVVFAGRAYRMPLVEEVKRMDLSTMEVEVKTSNAFCKGGIRINVQAVANVKVASDRKIVGNAIERFLTQDRSEIGEVARQTLEGHLRAVLANLTPEEVNEDRLKFAEILSTEAEADLNKLGLHLDTFNINSVSDVNGSSYLSEIGRKALAEVIKNAEVSEALCEREATQAEAAARSKAEVSQEQAETAIRTRTNELRKAVAEFEARAKSVEEQAEAAKQTARAVAEQELQAVRSELEGKRLQAEVVVRAEAETTARELRARGDAAPIAEQGKALATSLEKIREAWVAAGDGAKPIFMIQELDTVLRSVVDRVKKVSVKKVSLVDKGDGSSLPAYVASYPAAVNSVLKELKDVTGIDVVGTLAKPTPQPLATSGGEA